MSKNKNQPKAAPPGVLNGSNTLPAQIELAEGKSVPLGDVVRHAFSASGLSVEDWNKLEPAKADELLLASIETLKSAPPAAGGPPEKDPPKSPIVKARVLSSFRLGDDQHQPNDLVELTPAEAAGLADYIDASPAAVAYAQALRDGTGS